MVGATDATEDAPSSQNAKTLVPVSLSLVAKKERILQLEAAKLEKLLAQRNEVLCRLRESHEKLLATNGQLQERSRLRRERLGSLRMQLAGQGQDEADKSGLCDAIGTNELEATAEKCSVLKDILLGLEDKRTVLEQQTMEFEEETTKRAAELRCKEERLNEVKNTLLLLHEDIRSVHWNFENDQTELAEADTRLISATQTAQHEAEAVKHAEVALRTDNMVVEDLRSIWQNFQDMAHEELRQLTVKNEEARSEQHELQYMLESNGATCPADEEVLQVAKDLQTRLQRINEEVTGDKFFKRELALRRKQEKDMLAIAQSSMKAKDEQLTWLERQLKHLENEQKEAAKTYADEEAAYLTVVEKHDATLASLETQIKDAEKKIKSLERAISARNKKIAAVSKKVAQKTKELAEWKTKIDVKQTDIANSAATQQLIDGEVQRAQELLDKEQSRFESFQQRRTAQEMETEELRSSCATLETETHQLRKSVATMKDNAAAAQTAVKNRVDEIREKFLSSFVVNDVDILIDLLNKEIESWSVKDSDTADADLKKEAKALNQKYDELASDTRRKYGKILKQKERQYKAKREDLETRAEERKARLAGIPTDEGEVVRHSCVSGTLQGLDKMDENKENKRSPVAERDNDIECQQFNPPWLELGHTEGVVRKPQTTRQRAPKPKQTQRKTKVSKQVPKSARRQLAPGLNLADDSQSIDKDPTIVDAGEAFATEAEATFPLYSVNGQLVGASGARRPRLKRRTPAQKSGKLAVSEKRLPTPTTASTTPDHELPRIAEPNPAVGILNQGSLDSPVGCDEDPVASPSAHGPSSPKKPTEAVPIASQNAAKKSLLQKGGPRSKGAGKRRTSTNRSHLSKKVKAGRISLGRSQAVDWSAADSFSFA